MRTKKKDEIYCGVRKEIVENAEPVLNEDVLALLQHFITERYRIHKRKDVKGWSRPYTKDPILNEYKFCNVRREHDRQSRYLIENISTNPDLNLEDKIVNTFLFRSWNNWSTLKDFGFPYYAEEIYDPEFKERIRPIYWQLNKEEPNRRWWCNAYNQGGFKMVWGYPDGTCKSVYQRAGAKRKHEPDIPLRPLHIGPYIKKHKIVEKIMQAHNQEEVYEIIKTVPGFAAFMAYQIFVDLTYIPEFPFSENEFTIAGPGCRKGIDALVEDVDDMTYEEFLFWLRNAINEGNLFTDWHPEKLFSDLPKYDRCVNVMSLENCFCELSKYLRCHEGLKKKAAGKRTGTCTRRYKPTE